MKFPRIMLAATSSGSGKTLITCGILQALVNRKLITASFKCGPDYIDPMFHTKIIGTRSSNLDTFFTDKNLTRYLFAETAKEADISVIEGVMGYYDGIAGVSTKASSYDLAKCTKTPVILIVGCKGMSLSILSVIQGFLQFRSDSQIAGVILNQISKSLYPQMKKAIEKTLSIKVFGYVPIIKDLSLESRHLGLVTPDEIHDLQEKMDKLAKLMEETLELDEVLLIAEKAPKISYQVPKLPWINGEPLIAVAKDPAFCFYYKDNLEILKKIGAKLVEFSPLQDEQLPENIDGLLLGGGYPELYARELSQNTSMLVSIYKALEKGLPSLAECGGFMYLHESLEDMQGKEFPMVGVINGKAFRTNQLNRFGYITMNSNKNQLIAEKGEIIRGHEFHYFDSTSCGESFTARKPIRNKEWNCLWGNDSLAAGFPHLYYYSNPNIPYHFLSKCMERKEL